MADTKITVLTALTAADPANDVIPIVDISDTSMAASGTTKKISVNNILGASGTATLASATITGDLTVRTNKLVVNTNGVGIGTTNPFFPLVVNGTDTTNVLFNGITKGVRFSASASTSAITGVDNTGSVSFQPLSIGGSTLDFALSGSTAMTLNSTGLGVGYVPSGSADKLGSAATLGVVATGSTADLNFRNSSLTAIQRIRYTDGTGVLTIGSATGTSYSVELGGNTTTRAVTIDASSNVGIGVTPSAWRSNYRAIEIARAGSGFWSQTDSSRVGMSANTYFNSSSQFIYSDTSAATYYNQVSGQHQWFNAPSGTAGSAITFTQAMTLDASGNLLLGVASSSNRLDIQKSTDCAILVKSTGANTNIAMDYVTNYGNHTIRKSGTAVWDFGVINDSSATPAFKFSNGTDRLIIDASGRLLVGTTVLNASWDTRLTLSSDVGTTRWAVGPYVAPQNFVISAGAGTGVYLNGTAATSWTSLSDERLKDIIEPISNAVSKVASLRAVIGKFKFDENNTRKPFLIAQDIQAVLPEAVDASNPDKLGVAYTDVIPLLVAAIKELTARVQTLEAK